MERMRQPYDAVMAMPAGRRKRFCQEKEHLDRHVAANNKPRRKGR